MLFTSALILALIQHENDAEKIFLHICLCVGGNGRVETGSGAKREENGRLRDSWTRR